MSVPLSPSVLKGAAVHGHGPAVMFINVSNTSSSYSLDPYFDVIL
jgi:hypothetical protein